MFRYEIKPASTGRVREVAPEYGAGPATAVYSVTMADRGRLVLPAAVREHLKIQEGDRLALTVEQDGTITLKTRDVVVDGLPGMFKHLPARPGQLASERLIAERRRQARMEDREFRERLARRQRKRSR